MLQIVETLNGDAMGIDKLSVFRVVHDFRKAIVAKIPLY